MRFDKMETYAEHSLQLTSQGPRREARGLFPSFPFFIVYRH